jgi:hypothetical protein
LRLKQGRRCADEADSGNKYTACQHLHFKPIGAGLALTKLVCQDFPLMKLCLSGLLPDEALLKSILKILGTFFVKKKGSIKQ